MRILRRLKSIAIILGLCGGIGILYWALIWYQYYGMLPRSPQPAEGRVYVMNMHGVAVYATRRERDRLDKTGSISLALVGIGLVGGILTSSDYRRRMGWRNLEEPCSDRPRPPQPGS